MCLQRKLPAFNVTHAPRHAHTLKQEKNIKLLLNINSSVKTDLLINTVALKPFDTINLDLADVGHGDRGQSARIRKSHGMRRVGIRVAGAQRGERSDFAECVIFRSRDDAQLGRWSPVLSPLGLPSPQLVTAPPPATFVLHVSRCAFSGEACVPLFCQWAGESAL